MMKSIRYYLVRKLKAAYKMEQTNAKCKSVQPLMILPRRIERPRPVGIHQPFLAPPRVQHSPRPQRRLFIAGDPSSFPPDEMAAGAFAETYRIGKMLGNGSFGCVCLARNRRTGKDVVAKFVLKPSYDPTKPTNLPPLEIQILEKIRRQFGVASLISTFENDNFFQIVMKQHGHDAIDLEKFIERKGLGIPEPLAAHIFRQLTRAVSSLHRIHGILHRDLKPANFLIDNRFRVQLIDFGCATFMKPEGVAAFNATPLFRSPEAVFRRLCQGPEVEVWALGITLYYMVFKCYPFRTVDEMQRMPICIPSWASKALKDLFAGMLNRDFRRRWTTDNILADRWVNQFVFLPQFHFY